MRSEVAKRILEGTPKELRDKVRKLSDKRLAAYKGIINRMKKQK